MICEKYKPKSIQEIIGNKQNILSIVKWCNEFQKTTSKALLLSGKTGIGKTLAIELITSSLNYSVIYLAGDERGLILFFITSLPRFSSPARYITL